MILNEIEIPKYLYLTEPINEALLKSVNFFGPTDSFNLTPLEYIYHIRTGFKPFNSQYMGDCWFLFDPTDLTKICVYANVKYRFAYAGAAREQLSNFCRYNPNLKKLLLIRPTYSLKAKIRVLKNGILEDDTIINYVGSDKNEFIHEKQYWEKYIENRYDI